MRKPGSLFALALLSGVGAFYTFRLNPEGLDSIDKLAAVFFGLLAVGLAVAGFARVRGRDS